MHPNSEESKERIEKSCLAEVPSEARAYSRRTTPPKLIPPIDKIYMRVKSRIDIGLVEELRDRKRWYRPKRGFRADKLYSGLFDFGEKRSVTIHNNDFQGQIEFNPTQWDSFEGLFTVISKLCSVGDSYINRIDLHVNIPIELEEVRRSFVVPRKTKTTVFRTETRTKRSGVASDIEFSGMYGSDRTYSIAIYDAYKKHSALGFKHPCTRIELRYHINRMCPAKTLGEVRFLSGEKLFSKIGLLKPKSTVHLRGREKIYYELLVLYRETIGLREAISRIGRLDPKHGHSIVKRLTTTMESHEVNLAELFDRQLKLFLTAKISRSERRVIELLDKRRKKSSHSDDLSRAKPRIRKRIDYRALALSTSKVCDVGTSGACFRDNENE